MLHFPFIAALIVRDGALPPKVKVLEDKHCLDGTVFINFGGWLPILILSHEPQIASG
jgi:hypothetical protein